MSLLPRLRSRIRVRLLIVICIISLVFTVLVRNELVSAAGTTITVNSTSEVANSTDGLCTLREAIIAANTNTASGAITGECPAGSSDGSDTIDLTGLTGSITLTSVLPNLSSDMTLSGPGSSSLTIQRSNSPFIGFFVDSIATVTISGLTVDGGDPSNVPPGNSGIVNSGNGRLNLLNCRVTRFGRGIINSSQRSLTISNCVVNGNGGGISNFQGTINLVNSVVSGNSSNGAFGPGIDNSGTLNVTNSTISSNTGHIAIMNGVGATAAFTNTTISNNVDGGLANNGTLSMIGGSVVGNSNGGAVLAGPSIMNGVTVSNNSSNGGAFIGGGGIFISGIGRPEDHATIINCLITNNSTTANGGGIRNGGGKATIINTTISGNTSNGTGGGINMVDGGLGNFVGINLTITGNRAANGGGGVFRESGPMKFKNSLIARNFHFSGANSDIGTTIDASSSFNLIGVGGSGGLTNGVNNNLVGVADPRLGPLANNGGPTQTHALLTDSPALDAGDNCVTETTHCGEPNLPQLTTDQRGAGFNRIVDGPDANTTATVDIGAYETQLPLASLPNATTNEDTQLVVTFDAGDTSTITSVTATSSNPTLVPNDSAHLTAALAGTTGVVTINPSANLFGTTDVTITVNRTGGSEVKTFTLTVNSSNDAPSFTKGSDQTLLEDAGAQIVANWATNLSTGPADEGTQTLAFEVTSNTNPTLFSSGPTISSTGTLTYTPAPNANGIATITIVLKDNGGTANGGVDTSSAQTFVISITSVNDAPSFTKGPDQTVNEDSGPRFVSWATNISTGAPNELQQLTFEVTDNTNPTLFSVSPGVSFTGTLGFTPAPNANGAATITIRLRDNGGTANGGVDTSASQTFTITVLSVNDRPVNTVPFTQGAVKNTPLIFSAANSNQISINDVDAGNAAVQVTLTTSNGVLTLASTTGLSFSAGNGNANASMMFTGTISNINAALNGMFFVPTNSFEGVAQLQIITNDLGNSGSGGALSDTDTVNINVVQSTVQFNASAYAVVEGSDLVKVTVTRIGGTGAASVNYSTSDRTAFGGASCTPGIDYVNQSGTLSWAEGETTPKTFTIPICEDSLEELDESVDLILFGPTGAFVGAPQRAVLTIANAGPPVLLTEENTQHAIALDSPIATRDPFSLTNLLFFGTDSRRRISLFVWRLALRSTDTPSNLTVVAEDSEGRVYPLTVEFVGSISGPPLVNQVVVRLPDNVVGAPRDLSVTVQLRSSVTNRAFIQIAGP
jgi:hypothetical protein